MKAMLIDDEYLIIGSCNFDCFSYYFEQEIVAVLTDANIIRQFKEKVIDVDNANSIPYEGKTNNEVDSYRVELFMNEVEKIRRNKWLNLKKNKFQ